MGRRKTPPPHADAPSLELDEAAMRDLLAQAGDLVMRHITSLPSMPAALSDCSESRKSQAWVVQPGVMAAGYA